MWPDEDGGWSITDRPTGFEVNTSGTVTSDVYTASTASGGQDRWTGLFESVLSNGANYLIQRDAADNGLVYRNGQWVRANALPVPGGNMTGLLLIGGLVLVAVLIAKK